MLRFFCLVHRLYYCNSSISLFNASLATWSFVDWLPTLYLVFKSPRMRSRTASKLCSSRLSINESLSCLGGPSPRLLAFPALIPLSLLLVVRSPVEPACLVLALAHL